MQCFREQIQAEVCEVLGEDAYCLAGTWVAIQKGSSLSGGVDLFPAEGIWVLRKQMKQEEAGCHG